MCTSNIHRRNQLENNINIIEESLKKSVELESERKEAQAVACIKSNPKYFYKYASKKSKVKTRVGPLKIDKNKVISEPGEIAETLNQYYQNVFSKPVREKVVENPIDFFNGRNQANQAIHNVELTKTNIELTLNELSNNSAAGPDNFPAIFLKSCAKELSFPLYLFYRNTLDCGVIPDDLKRARITPIHKGGPRSEPKNYRPVALTSHIIKVLERIIVRQITSFLEKNDKMNPHQHGFRAGRSCLSQLLGHYEKILEVLEHNKNADVVYLDFRAAFDKVDHGILLHKLRQVGISGDLGVWLHAFLTNRVQTVAVDGALSTPRRVISGVPQGTVVGPLLFLIHILDINENVCYSNLSSFADDTRIMREVSSDEDIQLLQADLQSLYTWADQNNMTYNNTKFEHMSYRADTNETVPVYMANDGSPIETVNHVSDLGVLVDSNGNFTAHIHNVVKRARSQVGMILRTFKTREILPMLTLYKSLVVPLLEYCCQLWDPWRMGEKQLLEAVQRSFTSKISAVKHLDYWERLEALDLYSLERRRERYAIIYVYKSLTGKAINNLNISWKDNPRRGRSCELQRPHSRASTRVKTLKENSFSIRGPKLFNTLPRNIRDSEELSLEQFKSKLDKFLQTIPDQPKLPHYHLRALSNSIIDQLALRRADGIY